MEDANYPLNFHSAFLASYTGIFDFEHTEFSH